MILLLIGYRGCGKTTIGKMLASRLSLQFTDLDVEVLARFSSDSVVKVWESYGESAWREMEAQVIDDVLSRDNQVVALGGGAPMIANVRKSIDSSHSRFAVEVLYLHCSVHELSKRLQASGHDRPALTDAGVIGEIPNILAEREPEYRSLATMEFDTTSMMPLELTEKIIANLARRVR